MSTNLHPAEGTDIHRGLDPTARGLGSSAVGGGQMDQQHNQKSVREHSVQAQGMDG
jgi:hypothetical protein